MSLLWFLHVTAEHALNFLFFFFKERGEEEEKKVFSLLQEGSPTKLNGVKYMVFGFLATRESLSS